MESLSAALEPETMYYLISHLYLIMHNRETSSYEALKRDK